MLAKDIKAGFESPWWTAIEDAEGIKAPGPDHPDIRLHVRYPDGGDAYRGFFSDQDIPEKS